MHHYVGGVTCDVIFKDATVIDGTGAQPFVADVAVSGRHIADIGSVTQDAHTTIDATNLVLSPGFIDVHTHDDFALLKDPELACKTLQGVTTVVTGNCGTSAVPLGDWLEKVQAVHPSVNVVPLIGHGSVREAILGRTEQRIPTSSELQQMISLVSRALDAGASGISTGLVYVPGAFSSFEEVLALTSVVAERGGIYTSHLRNEADGLLDSIDEALELGRRTGIRVHLSHLKAIGPENFEKIPIAIEKIKSARVEGLSVMADQYPYARGSTSLDQLVARGAFDGPSPFGFVQGEDVLIASLPKSPSWEGKTLNVVASELGLSTPDAAKSIVKSFPETCFVVYRNQSEENIELIMREDFVMIGSDGVPMGSRPHPRLHHTFPRVLGEFVRNRQTLPLHTAIHKMTGMCAKRFGLTNRGRIQVGNFADLVLFNPLSVRDTGDYENPTTIPEGIIGTWVNGQRTTEDGRSLGARAGQTIHALQ